MHAAVFDYGNNMMFVSIAGPNVDNNGNILPGSTFGEREKRCVSQQHLPPPPPQHTDTTAPAYARPWFGLNMTEALNLSF